ncbi:hypothetical protein GWK47_048889 [Chionoecetes opilio]|uniref:Uncharacterized protein n=1 Tax=Chionoecetes opilio TaxID=41210 RepID=A0A8J4Y2L2_CHIOP|nr:hypothetical protein GWK47_048889 [Chionoecetes opilio]
MEAGTRAVVVFAAGGAAGGETWLLKTVARGVVCFLPECTVAQKEKRQHWTAAVKMFHILETRPTNVRWCCLARERGTSTASPLVSTVLVLRVAILGGSRNSASQATPCTCALWNTTSAATSLRYSSESRGLTGSIWVSGSGRSAASTSRRARRWMLSSLLVCEAAHDIQERAAYSK